LKVINKAYGVCLIGDYLVKCNENNDAKQHKFFKITNLGELRWAKLDKNID